MASLIAIRAGVLGVLLGCGSSTRHDLQVMSYTPQGPIDRAGPIAIKFDKPVVAEAMVGQPAAPGSIAITPPIAWKSYWQDRQTLAIEPTTTLAGSTRYRVALSGELASRTAGFELAFVHQPLTVEGGDPRRRQPARRRTGRR